MDGPSDNTPFLDDNDHILVDSHDETESRPLKPSPANDLKRPIQILTIIILFLSLAIFGLLTATYVLINAGPFKYTWSSREVVRHLAICVSRFLFPFNHRSHAHEISTVIRKHHLLRSDARLKHPDYPQQRCEHCDANRGLRILRQDIWEWPDGF
jgi:hypothetical protein